MRYTEKISNKLNDLLEKTYDAEKGYKLAQDKVESLLLKNFLSGKVQQRYNFGQELKIEIMEYGQLPDKGGSVKGGLHRTWVNITTSLSNDKEEAVLKEVERGEKASLEEYNEILHTPYMVLVPSTKELLLKHRDAIQSSLRIAKKYEELIS